MITVEQAKVLKSVLTRFVKGETLPWTEFDDHMEMLAWLTDEQLVLEAEVKLEFLASRRARCETNHSPDECYVPVILEAMAYILDEYDVSEKLVKSTRYMLQYFLALAQIGAIIHDD